MLAFVDLVIHSLFHFLSYPLTLADGVLPLARTGLPHCAWLDAEEYAAEGGGIQALCLGEKGSHCEYGDSFQA